MDWRHVGELLEAGDAVYDEMLNLDALLPERTFPRD
jgi:hypothetical protein